VRGLLVRAIREGNGLACRLSIGGDESMRGGTSRSGALKAPDPAVSAASGSSRGHPAACSCRCRRRKRLNTMIAASALSSRNFNCSIVNSIRAPRFTKGAKGVTPQCISHALMSSIVQASSRSTWPLPLAAKSLAKRSRMVPGASEELPLLHPAKLAVDGVHSALPWRLSPKGSPPRFSRRLR